MKNKKLSKVAVLMFGIMLTFSMISCETVGQFFSEAWNDAASAREESASSQPTQQPAQQQPAQQQPAQQSTAQQAYRIGDRGPGGGIIFYDKGSFSDGWRYLEAAPENVPFLQAGYRPWSQTNILIPGLSQNSTDQTDWAIGRGRQNTTLIMAAYPNAHPDYLAAKASVDYRGPNNLDDWFLPSKNELAEMYRQRTYLRITSDILWSSSQRDLMSAWVHVFADGSQATLGKDNTRCGVRAVRAF